MAKEKAKKRVKHRAEVKALRLECEALRAKLKATEKKLAKVTMLYLKDMQE